MIIIKFAQNKKGVIGNGNKIPWHCSEDLKDFKKATVGKVVVMGRKTFESLGSRPLPKRLNVVLSMNDEWVKEQNKNYGYDNLVFISDVKDILNPSSTFRTVFEIDCDVFIIGGAFLIESVIRQYRYVIDEVQISLINDDSDGDTVVNPDLINLCKKVVVTEYDMEKK